MNRFDIIKFKITLLLNNFLNNLWNHLKPFRYDSCREVKRFFSLVSAENYINKIGSGILYNAVTGKKYIEY